MENRCLNLVETNNNSQKHNCYINTFKLIIQWTLLPIFSFMEIKRPLLYLSLAKQGYQWSLQWGEFMRMSFHKIYRNPIFTCLRLFHSKEKVERSRWVILSLGETHSNRLFYIGHFCKNTLKISSGQVHDNNWSFTFDTVMYANCGYLNGAS